MPAVVLMPSFGSCPYRTENEAHVVEHYRQRWKLPVVIGRDTFRDGLYARTRAINNAAREAFLKHPTHDVFVLCDNDLLPDEETFAKALKMAHDHAAITPHSETHLLTRTGRMQYLKTGRSRNYSVIESGSRSFVVIRREVFRAVNGMDEKFRGWGPEDKAFIVSVEKQAGPVLALPGKRLHLWHPLDPSRFKKEALARNRARFHQYAVASPEGVHRLAREYGLWEEGSSPSAGEKAPQPPPSPGPVPLRKFNHEIGLKNVHDLLQTLSRHGVRSWVQDGTLLGLVRDGKLIDWDHDTDTGAMVEDLTPGVVTALQAEGFTLNTTLGTREDGLQHRWVRDGVKTDIFWYYTRGDGTVWHAAYDRKRQYRYPYKPFTVAPIETSAGTMMAPDPPEDFLLAKYGEDWRTPRKQWHFAKDPKNARAM